MEGAPQLSHWAGGEAAPPTEPTDPAAPPPVEPSIEASRRVREEREKDTEETASFFRLFVKGRKGPGPRAATAKVAAKHNAET